MRAVTTIFLSNTLSAILEHIDQTPDLDPQLPGLLEFKSTVMHEIQQLRMEGGAGHSSGETRAA